MTLKNLLSWIIPLPPMIQPWKRFVMLMEAKQVFSTMVYFAQGLLNQKWVYAMIRTCTQEALTANYKRL